MTRFNTPFKRSVCICLIASMLCQGALLQGEAVDDKFTQISPQGGRAGEEYIHGTGYGKILMRVMMFGAIPKQGIHYYPEGTDLLFAILYAGGYTDETKLSAISIRRRSVKNLIEIDLAELVEEGGAIPKLFDGDVVNVPFNWRKDYSTLMFYTGVFTTLGTLLIGIAAVEKAISQVSIFINFIQRPPGWKYWLAHCRVSE